MSESPSNPYLSFAFQVQIESIIVGGFSEVTGLEMEMEPESYEEGGVNGHIHMLPGRISYPNLVLQRGLTDYQDLWQWVQGAMDEETRLSDVRKTVTIVILDSQGNETWGWQCQNAYPVKWAGPELKADEGAVAMETLELAHTGLSKLSQRPRYRY
jgi:phage tail-like protein